MGAGMGMGMSVGVGRWGRAKKASRCRHDVHAARAHGFHMAALPLPLSLSALHESSPSSSAFSL